MHISDIDAELQAKSQSDMNSLTHLPLDKTDAISQAMYSNASSWMKSFVFW